jgi:hypothetical protein
MQLPYLPESFCSRRYPCARWPGLLETLVLPPLSNVPAGFVSQRGHLFISHTPLSSLDVRSRSRLLVHVGSCRAAVLDHAVLALAIAPLPCLQLRCSSSSHVDLGRSLSHRCAASSLANEPLANSLLPRLSSRCPRARMCPGAAPRLTDPPLTRSQVRNSFRRERAMNVPRARPTPGRRALCEPAVLAGPRLVCATRGVRARRASAVGILLNASVPHDCGLARGEVFGFLQSPDLFAPADRSILGRGANSPFVAYQCRSPSSTTGSADSFLSDALFSSLPMLTTPRCTRTSRKDAPSCTLRRPNHPDVRVLDVSDICCSTNPHLISCMLTVRCEVSWSSVFTEELTLTKRKSRRGSTPCDKA